MNFQSKKSISSVKVKPRESEDLALIQLDIKLQVKDIKQQIKKARQHFPKVQLHFLKVQKPKRI